MEMRAGALCAIPDWTVSATYCVSNCHSSKGMTYLVVAIFALPRFGYSYLGAVAVA